MDGEEVLISTLGTELRAAFLEGGELRRLVIAPPDHRPRVGDIVLGRIVKVAAQLNAAFVNLGFDRDGFLELSQVKPMGAKDERIGAFVSEGDAVLVQVQTEPLGAKGAKVTARPALAGRYLVFLPGQAGVRLSRGIEDVAERARLVDAVRALDTGTEAATDGWIVRSVAAGAPVERIVAEASWHRKLWSEVQQRCSVARAPQSLCRGPDAVLAAIIEESGRTFRRVIADNPRKLADVRGFLPDVAARWEFHSGATGLFEAYGVEEQIQALLSPTVGLPSGGMIDIAETAAVVAIDVDTGSASRGNPEDTALSVNLEAAAAAARHIRLRDLAGHMVIDFAPMRRRDNRSRVVSALRLAMERDRRPFQLAGFTPFGLVELTRQRRERSLKRRLTTACPTCEGVGRIRSPAAIAHEALRRVLAEARAVACPAMEITASPSVVAALRGDAAPGLSEVEEKLGITVFLKENGAFAPESFDVTTIRRGKN